MRCPKCGFPISPTNTSMTCPRCQSTLGSGPPPTRGASLQVEQTWGRGTIVGTPPQVEQRDVPLPQPQWETPSFPPSLHTPHIQQTSQPNQMWLPGPAQPPTNSRANGERPGRPFQSDRGGTFHHPPNTRPLAGTRPYYDTSRKVNPGFIVAGICVATGALILIFVSFMLASLQNTPSTNNTSTLTSPGSTPTSTQPSPTVALSLTPTYPGQQYVDNAQMASTIDTTTAKPIQLTTAFKAGQNMYVTFNIHPAGHNGAVCLRWYLNTFHISDADYSFAVTPNNTAGYSYAIYGPTSTGAAYVEIYWASTKACGDKVLAQHVAFTVTP